MSERKTIYADDAIKAIDVLCQEHRYKIPGKRETYSPYNEAWQDALDRAECAIEDLPSADVVEVVRCKHCKHFDGEKTWCYQDIYVPFDHFYCYNGEREEDEAD